MKEASINTQVEGIRYKAMIGTGGIGSGSLFLLRGNHTLGREESRGGKFLNAKDYCKLHIISHNVKKIMGPDFLVFPVGKVGEDDIGRSIYLEMEQAGLEMQYVRYSANDRTLFGFCFLYPDGTGGNLTTEDSASTKVDPVFIDSAIPVFSKFSGNFISLSSPEVPLAARKELLEISREYNGFSAASFTSGEMAEADENDLFKLVDLLAINIDEAAAFTQMDAGQDKPQLIVEKTIDKMIAINPSAMLSITFGKHGSWSWDGRILSFVPVFPVEAKSSAGAGDAHFAGIISGLSSGMTLKQAQVLGSLAGAFSVTSPHTIHPGMSRKNLRKLAHNFKNRIEPDLLEFLAD